MGHYPDAVKEMIEWLEDYNRVPQTGPGVRNLISRLKRVKLDRFDSAGLLDQRDMMQTVDAELHVVFRDNYRMVDYPDEPLEKRVAYMIASEPARIRGIMVKGYEPVYEHYDYPRSAEAFGKVIARKTHAAYINGQKLLCDTINETPGVTGPLLDLYMAIRETETYVPVLNAYGDTGYLSDRYQRRTDYLMYADRYRRKINTVGEKLQVLSDEYGLPARVGEPLGDSDPEWIDLLIFAGTLAEVMKHVYAKLVYLRIRSVV